MKTDTWKRLDEERDEFSIMFAEDVPSEEEVDAGSAEIGMPFPPDYRDFLLRYGGAMVGAYPIFGFREAEVMGKTSWSVVDMTKRFRSFAIEGTSGWIVFSEDHAGNPIGMDADGKVWIFDHDFGGIAELTADFEEYLRKRCLKVDE